MNVYFLKIKSCQVRVSYKCISVTINASGFPRLDRTIGFLQMNGHWTLPYFLIYPRYVRFLTPQNNHFIPFLSGPLTLLPPILLPFVKRDNLTRLSSHTTYPSRARICPPDCSPCSDPKSVPLSLLSRFSISFSWVISMSI